MDLNGKVALITGPNSGIGQATAVAFAEVGADVRIAFHTDEDGATETKRHVEAAGAAWRTYCLSLG
jgi:glucose 1-dehydrogenase